MPKSGAPVAIDTGQTLWIAVVNGKMQVIALDDYVNPRKDGFWRILLPSKSLPPDVWAVPLGKSKDVIAEQERAAIFFPAGGPPAVSAYRTNSPDVFA